MSKQPGTPPAGRTPTSGGTRTTTGNRAQSTRPQQRRAAFKRQRRPWWRGPVPLIGTLVVIVVAVVIFLVVANNGNSADASIGKAADLENCQPGHVDPTVDDLHGGRGKASRRHSPAQPDTPNQRRLAADQER